VRGFLRVPWAVRNSIDWWRRPGAAATHVT
jgi:hypothetical protein